MVWVARNRAMGFYLFMSVLAGCRELGFDSLLWFAGWASLGVG